ncbi:MAG: Recombination protein RecR [Candidatus Anoxychlamydiales bacterium]|nr:Recombination protein RecR [Candidatus Anoxychlamydiales bacterium]
MYPKDLLKLIHYLKKLSGVGAKTAERFAFELLKYSDFELDDLGNLFKDLKKNILYCSTCGCLIAENICKYCDSNLRDSKKLCIVSSFRDVFVLEKTKTYNGFYHILETLISPIEGKEIDEENITRLKKRIENFPISEVIIALDSTIEGDATSLYIKEELLDYKVNISRLAFGLPIGTSLDYIDRTTLTQAFVGRQSF